MTFIHSQATQNYNLFQEEKKNPRAPCYPPSYQMSKCSDILGFSVAYHKELKGSFDRTSNCDIYFMPTHHSQQVKKYCIVNI